MYTTIKDNFLGVWNHPKNVLQILVPWEYGLTSGFSKDNKTMSEDLLPNAFHSPPAKNCQQPDPMQFQHKILQKGIKGSWFSSQQAIGYMHAAKFWPMPLPTIALVCIIIHFLISDFSSSEQQLSKLDAEHQAPWFKRHLAAWEDMAKPRNCPQRQVNIQCWLFDQCHGKYQPGAHRKIQPAVVDYASGKSLELLKASGASGALGAPLLVAGAQGL